MHHLNQICKTGFLLKQREKFVWHFSTGLGMESQTYPAVNGTGLWAETGKTMTQWQSLLQG